MIKLCSSYRIMASRLRLSLNLMVVLCMLTLVNTTPLAAETKTSSQPPANPQRQLEISPLRTVQELKAGTVFAGSIKLRNKGSEPLQVSLKAEAFNIKDLSYDYSFLPNSELNSWVKFSVTDFGLASKEVRSIDYVVNVPTDTEPGGKYLGLIAATTVQNSPGITTTDRVGSLLYLSVPGDSTTKVDLLSFSSAFIDTGRPTWSVTLQNKGTVHYTSDYVISLKNLLGGTVSQTDSSSLLLPGTVRLIQGDINSPQWLGVYQLNYRVALGDSGEAVGTRMFVYLPLGQTLSLLTITVACILFIQNGISKRRQSKRSKPKAQ